MILCKLSIPLRVNLSVPSGSFFVFEVDGKLVGIEILVVYGESIISYADNPDWINRGSGEAKIAVIKAKKSGKGEEILRVYFSERGIVGNGYIQPNRFCVINLYFEEQSSARVNLSGKKLWVEQCINYFISHYLEIGCDNDIQRICISDIPIITISTADCYEFSKEGLRANFTHNRHQFNWYDTQRTGHLKEDFPVEWLSLLQEKLDSGSPVLLHNSLLIDAKRQSFFYGNQELSIVLCESSFEVFASNRLAKYCAENGIKELFSGKGSRRISMPVDEFTEKQNIDNLLMAASEVTGVKIKEGTEHLNWKKYAYEERNKIVHRGAVGYTKDQAKKAFQVVNDYMKHLRSVLQIHS